MPELVLLSLDWWTDPLKVCVGIPFLPTLPTLTLVMHASSLGLGAHIGSLKTQGLWSSQDLEAHINVRELKAVRLSCSTFLPYIWGEGMYNMTDNSVTIFYINNQGGAWSTQLCKEAVPLWVFCITNSIHLKTVSLPGKQNTLADQLSRSLPSNTSGIDMCSHSKKKRLPTFL